MPKAKEPKWCQESSELDGFPRSWHRMKGRCMVGDYSPAAWFTLGLYSPATCPWCMAWHQLCVAHSWGSGPWGIRWWCSHNDYDDATVGWFSSRFVFNTIVVGDAYTMTRLMMHLRSCWCIHDGDDDDDDNGAHIMMVMVLRLEVVMHALWWCTYDDDALFWPL